MRMAPPAEVKDHFSRYVDKAQAGPIVVTKNGRPAAVLVSVPEDEEDLERFLLANNPKFQRIIEAAEKRIRKGAGISNKEFWQATSKRKAA